MVNNYQRLGSTSNSHVGRDFETVAQDYFRQMGIWLQKGHGVLTLPPKTVTQASRVLR